ncbi:DUF6864 domain-containing function [Bacillus sp. FJAT-27445]|uniref:DUF6864 domain-containing function n=1 Tax=Bacillus sp. FJAT-27445 TaxID=1679166 RepID=UPI00074321CA|nr:hypothetical protein [Bacillus sp. FJAT-27445]
MNNTFFSGTSEIVSSGLLIQFNKNPIEINVDLKGIPFKFIFDFIDAPNISEPKITASSPNSSTLILNLYNFNNPLGQGSKSPLNIGSINNSFIYLNFRVSTFNEGDKTLHYSIYLSQEELKL